MRLTYHPLVQRDVSGILRHYDGISTNLRDEFWAELTRLLDAVSAEPAQFHFADRGLWRANMRRFPYHVLFRVMAVAVRVILVRHNKGTRVMALHADRRAIVAAHSGIAPGCLRQSMRWGWPTDEFLVFNF